jgi:tetratricopeptide (TPR) repeat protein
MRAALVCILLVSTAHAERDKRAATGHFQQGSSLYADGRWSEALVEFEAGYEAYPLRGFLVNIGQCYRKLDRLEEAADVWRRFLATHPSDAKLRGEVEDALAEVESLLAKQKPAKVEPAPPPEAPPAPKLDLPSESVATAPAVEVTAASTPPKKKSKKWVWAVVSVALVTVAAAAVTVGVVEWQASSQHSGSLGLIDGRR